jgi:F0F1-type ATP synthase assembly protein I
MQSATLKLTYRNIIALQAVVIVFFSLIAFLWQGKIAGLSALCGGFMIWAGNLAYVVIARPSKVSAVSGNQVLMRHMLAETAKILIVLSLMLGAFTSARFDAVWLLAALIVALIGHGLSLMLLK